MLRRIHDEWIKDAMMVDRALLKEFADDGSSDELQIEVS